MTYFFENILTLIGNFLSHIFLIVVIIYLIWRFHNRSKYDSNEEDNFYNRKYVYDAFIYDLLDRTDDYNKYDVDEVADYYIVNDIVLYCNRKWHESPTLGPVKSLEVAVENLNELENHNGIVCATTSDGAEMLTYAEAFHLIVFGDSHVSWK